jgi:hypothetical protein
MDRCYTVSGAGVTERQIGDTQRLRGVAAARVEVREAFG